MFVSASIVLLVSTTSSSPCVCCVSVVCLVFQATRWQCSTNRPVWWLEGRRTAAGESLALSMALCQVGLQGSLGKRCDWPGQNWWVWILVQIYNLDGDWSYLASSTARSPARENLISADLLNQWECWDFRLAGFCLLWLS